jgi:hypothetical protein
MQYRFRKLFFLIFAIAICTIQLESAFAQSIKIETKEVVYTRPNPINDYKKTFSVTFPKVSGVDKTTAKKIENAISFENAWEITIEEERNESEWLEEAGFTVLYNKNGILSVELMINGSAAYPSLSNKYVVVDIKTGNKLNPGDVFVNQNQLLTEITKKQNAEIQDSIELIKTNPDFDEPNPEYLFEDKHFISKDLEEFIVDDKGITFVFNYSFPRYALALEPIGRYFFSWKEISPFINKKGVFARFIKAEQNFSLFHGNTSYECEKLYKEYLDNPENYSQTAMNMGAHQEQDCLRRVMNKSLDQRLLKLKTENPERFQIEMELQKAFNMGVEKFTEEFFSICDGSACGMCLPGAALYSYRTLQSDKINANSLNVPEAKQRETDSILIKKSFSEFANGLCQMPKDVWQKRSITKNCNEAVLADIKEKVRFFFSDSGSEGDVCSKLPN